MARAAGEASGHFWERRPALATGAGVVALAIFAADLLSPLQGAVAVLYIIVVLLVAQASGRRAVIGAGLGCGALTLLAFAADHLGDPIDSAYVRVGVSLVAITATTLLSLGQLRTEAERRRSEQRYRTIFDAAGFAIWESDWSATRRHLLGAVPEGSSLRGWLAAHPDVVRDAAEKAVIGDANQAAVALFGATGREQLIGRSVIGDPAPGTAAVIAEIFAALLEGAEMVEKEVRYLTLDGRPIQVVLRIRLLREGELWSRALMMALDVTERNEARARIEQASAELAHAARVSTLGQLAASIAHEVNQPLSAIINYGKSGKRWLSREVPETDEVANCLDQIVANGTRAADVIARVRALARKGTPEMEPLRLDQLVDEAVALIGREAGAAHVLVQRIGDGDLPAVVGDRVQIQQVLVNLLMNGIQAMQHVDGRPRALRIAIAPEGDGMVRVAVEDSGDGIAGEPARIFEPFFTTKSDGMGMGLSICRSIIEAQGGRIAAANNPGHGATIAFTLPTQAVRTAEAAAAIATSV